MFVPDSTILSIVEFGINMENCVGLMQCWRWVQGVVTALGCGEFVGSWNALYKERILDYLHCTPINSSTSIFLTRFYIHHCQ